MRGVLALKSKRTMSRSPRRLNLSVSYLVPSKERATTVAALDGVIAGEGKSLIIDEEACRLPKGVTARVQGIELKNGRLCLADQLGNVSRS